MKPLLASDKLVCSHNGVVLFNKKALETSK